MPLVVPSARIDDWLTDGAAHVVDLIAPAPEGALVATPVSKHVNKVKNDDPECLLPVTRIADDPQGRLF
jgi:putative SOS response-associated peptidase YedK